MTEPGRQKNEIRREALQKRMQLAQAPWQHKSEQVSRNFIESPYYQQADFIHCFVSINKRKEIDTRPLIKRMLLDGKKVVVPVTDFAENKLIHSRIFNETEWVSNKWGIEEPGDIHEIDIALIDTVIVPMLAADFAGNRIGYGKGFYDRFLGNTSAVKTGFVFHDFIFPNIPAEEFDIKMDMLITEKGIFKCNNNRLQA